MFPHTNISLGSSIAKVKPNSNCRFGEKRIQLFLLAISQKDSFIKPNPKGLSRSIEN
jgi:hypothetical protein